MRSMVRWILLAALLAGVVAQARRGLDRLGAGRLVRAAEARTLAATRAPADQARALLEGNLALLRRANELDPAEISAVAGRGGQYLLLGRPDAAIGAYRQALALEPRPEIYLNIGRAERLAGRLDEAEKNFAEAVRLQPSLASQVPP